MDKTNKLDPMQTDITELSSKSIRISTLRAILKDYDEHQYLWPVIPYQRWLDLSACPDILQCDLDKFISKYQRALLGMSNSDE